MSPPVAPDASLERLFGLLEAHNPDLLDLLRAQTEEGFIDATESAIERAMRRIEGGAKLYADQIRRRVIPLLRADIAVFERWIAEGKIAPVNATHLLFSIWAMTQTYADFSAQMTLVLDRDQLQQSDFDDAERLITGMVLAAVGLQDQPCQR